jgi:hypothetical protein
VDLEADRYANPDEQRLSLSAGFISTKMDEI